MGTQIVNNQNPILTYNLSLPTLQQTPIRNTHPIANRYFKSPYNQLSKTGMHRRLQLISASLQKYLYSSVLRIRLLMHRTANILRVSSTTHSQIEGNSPFYSELNPCVSYLVRTVRKRSALPTIYSMYMHSRPTRSIRQMSSIIVTLAIRVKQDCDRSATSINHKLLAQNNLRMLQDEPKYSSSSNNKVIDTWGRIVMKRTRDELEDSYTTAWTQASSKTIVAATTTRVSRYGLFKGCQKRRLSSFFLRWKFWYSSLKMLTRSIHSRQYSMPNDRNSAASKISRILQLECLDVLENPELAQTRVTISRGVNNSKIVNRISPMNLLWFEASVKIETLALMGGWTAKFEQLSSIQAFQVAADASRSCFSTFLGLRSQEDFLFFSALKSPNPLPSPCSFLLFLKEMSRIKFMRDARSCSGFCNKLISMLSSEEERLDFCK